MIISVRRWMSRIKFVSIFIIGTYLMFELLNTVSVWIAPVDKYREPHGRAVKAFQHDPNMNMDPNTFADRLRLFYWLGE
ncbi:DUF4227 family protein [Paenibacillus marinisediminis]